jgi:hypothetical protein
LRHHPSQALELRLFALLVLLLTLPVIKPPPFRSLL